MKMDQSTGCHIGSRIDIHMGSPHGTRCRQLLQRADKFAKLSVRQACWGCRCFELAWPVTKRREQTRMLLYLSLDSLTLIPMAVIHAVRRFDSCRVSLLSPGVDGMTDHQCYWLDFHTLLDKGSLN